MNEEVTKRKEREREKKRKRERKEKERWEEMYVDMFVLERKKDSEKDWNNWRFIGTEREREGETERQRERVE
jgi:hypothetical protein